MTQCVVRLTAAQDRQLREHLFQSSLEQAAFLFARSFLEGDLTVFAVEQTYYVPPEGWAHQGRFHLELNDAERARVMALARRSGLVLVDCHSHPGTKGAGEFSPSDVYGITEFAPYAHWKLDRRPYVAMVWAMRNLDGVVWFPGAAEPLQLSGVEVGADPTRRHECTGSWFWERPNNE